MILSSSSGWNREQAPSSNSVLTFASSLSFNGARRYAMRHVTSKGGEMKTMIMVSLVVVEGVECEHYKGLVFPDCLFVMHTA